MRFTDFERIARDVWDDIPEAYRQGVDGLIIEQEARPSDEHEGVFTLGECVTEQYPSQFGGPETTRSAVVLYYGSFRELAAEDAQFEWPREIYETVMHELKHHLEALANDDTLGDFDYAVAENFKRQSGEPFDAVFFRAGELLAPNLYSVEGDVFYEVLTLRRAPVIVDFEWEGHGYSVRLGLAQADVTFVAIANLEMMEGEFFVVRVMKRGVLATLRAAFGGGVKVREETTRAEKT